LFKNLIKVMGISAGNPDTVDNEQRVHERFWQFQLKDFNQEYETVRLIRSIGEFLHVQGFQGFLKE